MRVIICVIFFINALILLSPADVVLQDTFEKDKLDTLIWAPSDPNFVYVKEGVLVLDQKGSGTDWVGINTNPPPFKDCVIYYEWKFATYTGQGDCGGPLRKSFGTYHMRWGWGNTVNLVDSIQHGAIAAWTPLPTVDGKTATAPYPADSKNFVVKASFKFPRIKINIYDTDQGGKQIAKWEIKDEFYDSGVLGFDCWKFGVIHVDNVVVATPDWEGKIFSEGFDPVTLAVKGGQAVDAAGKLIDTWSGIKSLR